MMRRMAVLITLVATFAICCGCAGTKMANTANTGLLGEQRKAIQENDMPAIVDTHNEMCELQEGRNQTEGAANVPYSRDTVAIAKEKLRSQARLLGMFGGAIGAVGGAFFGDHWGKILALITLVTGIGAEEYMRRGKKKERKKREEVQKDRDFCQEVATDAVSAINDSGSETVKQRAAEYQESRGYIAKKGSIDQFKVQLGI